jgi:hypothetical protein
MGQATIGNISCGADISNHFSVAQYHLNDIRDMLNGRVGTWEGMVPDGGRFPVTSNFAARVTTLAQQRLGYRDLNLWQPMVAELGGDCAVSCDPPTKVVDPGNANHQWYRLMNIAYNTKPYCLESMFASGFDLPQQIEQIFKDLFMIRADVMDEFTRNNQVTLSAFKWLAYDKPQNQAGPSGLMPNQWQFATDANGFYDTRYIVLDNTVNPFNISLPSTDIFNRIREFGIPLGTFSEEEMVETVTDYTLFSNLPLYDTNRREDNRFRSPGVLEPSYVAAKTYANYKLKEDIYMLRYNWRGPGEVQGYPNGVLERVYQWTDEQITEGCFSQTSQAYVDADFSLIVLRSKREPVFLLQNGEQPLSAGSGVNFAATASPWDGTWRWVNEVNEVTPCNQDRNKGYWRMVLKKAAKPIMFGQRGHVLLVRRFPLRGIARSCAPAQTFASVGSPDCTNNLPCPAPDFFPPPLIQSSVCGGWNDGGVCTL